MSRLEKKLASGEKAARSTRRNVGLDVREDTSPAAQALKAHSPPGKGVPIIYLIAGILPSIRSAVQEMLIPACGDVDSSAPWSARAQGDDIPL